MCVQQHFYKRTYIVNECEKMKLKLLNRKNNQKSRKIKKEENIKTKENVVETPKKDRSVFQISMFSQSSALMKLRFLVSIIFLLFTIGMVVIFVGGWMITAVLFLIGYVLLFILTFNLFILKRL